MAPDLTDLLRLKFIIQLIQINNSIENRHSCSSSPWQPVSFYFRLNKKFVLWHHRKGLERIQIPGFTLQGAEHDPCIAICWISTFLMFASSPKNMNVQALFHKNLLVVVNQTIIILEIHPLKTMNIHRECNIALFSTTLGSKSLPALSTTWVSVFMQSVSTIITMPACNYMTPRSLLTIVQGRVVTRLHSIWCL